MKKVLVVEYTAFTPIRVNLPFYSRFVSPYSNQDWDEHLLKFCHCLNSIGVKLVADDNFDPIINLRYQTAGVRPEFFHPDGIVKNNLFLQRTLEQWLDENKPTHYAIISSRLYSNVLSLHTVPITHIDGVLYEHYEKIQQLLDIK